MEFRLPELGEGITTATVVSILVNPGDAVRTGQVLLEVETDKASMPVESPADATIAEILVRKGQAIGIGAPILPHRLPLPRLPRWLRPPLR
jgi:pyruvate dehydrogenase E2 component (dihydrolipoamide acetyltransferase)